MDLDLFVSETKPGMLCCGTGFGWMQPAFSARTNNSKIYVHLWQQLCQGRMNSHNPMKSPSHAKKQRFAFFFQNILFALTNIFGFWIFFERRWTWRRGFLQIERKFVKNILGKNDHWIFRACQRVKFSAFQKRSCEIHHFHRRGCLVKGCEGSNERELPRWVEVSKKGDHLKKTTLSSNHSFLRWHVSLFGECIWLNRWFTFQLLGIT